MKMAKLILITLILSILCTSCGTITRGTMQNVTITSIPPEAYIYVDNKPCGQTPQVISMTRYKNHHVVLVKEGYEPNHYILTSRVSWMLAGNLLYFPACVGVGTFLGVSSCGPFGSLCGLVMGIPVGALVTVGGVGVDLCTGAGYSLSHERIHAPLRPEFLQQSPI